MTLEQLKEELIELLLDNMDDEMDVEDDANFITDIGLSSMQMMLYIRDVEDELGIEIPVKRMDQVATFGEFFDVVVAILEED